MLIIMNIMNSMFWDIRSGNILFMLWSWLRYLWRPCRRLWGLVLLIIISILCLNRVLSWESWYVLFLV